MAGVQSGRRGSRGKKRRKGKPSKLNLCHATLTSEVEAPLEALLQTLGALIQQAKGMQPQALIRCGARRSGCMGGAKHHVIHYPPHSNLL